MIVSFSVSNFRSFEEEETLNLVASTRIPNDHTEHLVAIPSSKETVLRSAVIYGANGAGKSNFFMALEYFQDMLTNPVNKNTGTKRQAFRFGDEQNKSSLFDLQFITDGILYRLGFKVDDQRIVEEWFVRIEGSREIVLYERITDNEGNVKIEIKNDSNDKLKALATVGGPQNQTFLATIRTNLENKDYSDDIRRALLWIVEDLVLISPTSQFYSLGNELNKNPGFKQFASDFLKSSSTGIDGLEIDRQEISEEQLKTILSENEYALIRNKIETQGFAAYNFGEGEIVAEKGFPNRYYSLTIKAKHEHETGKNIPLNLSEESDGTKRLLNLIPALHFLGKKWTVFVIDEIDRSLHPLLTIKFIQFFLAACGIKNSQIIITTHESNLLDLDIWRRDEIWFTEKNEHGATKLYSLADFKVRTDLKINKHYLQGRFGAIPFLGNIDGLLEKECNS